MTATLFAKKKMPLFIFLGVILILAIALIALLLYIIFYRNPADKELADAGIVEKQIQMGNVLFNYAEGPDNGPALVLLHAQLLDWYTYSEVLPELSTKFHVYAIDYPGHGKTVLPEGYEMSANNIGSDLAAFIEQVIGEAAYVTGNSSGGLLTTWLAANRPDLVKAIVLEDPPLFSSEYPEIQSTIANKAFTTSYTALQNGYNDDYLMYWVENSTQFFETYTGKGSQQVIAFLIRLYRGANPDLPLELPFIPVSVQEMLRGMNEYDPHFGAAFYEGTWNEGFDHAEALQKISCPVLLIQADFSYTDTGVLNGAMSQEMADKVVELVENCTYVRVNAGHVTNLEVPEQFAQIVEDFFLSE